MSISEFYHDVKGHSKDKNNELTQLYKKGYSEREDMPKTQVFHPNIFYQADLLFMPQDKGFKYILVIADCYDSRIDAEPLKHKDAKTVLDAIKIIFNRNILQEPFIITFDQGTEFKGVVKQYLEKRNINVKYALTARHRQIAIVERANQKIGKILFQRMTAQELLTGEPNNMWVDDLKGLVKVLNENHKEPLETEISPDPIITKYNAKLIPIGTRVRIKLDYPINPVDRSRLYGKFRDTDIKYSPEIHRIRHVIIKPSFPPMYLIDNDNVARTKQQLNIVPKNEQPPNIKYIRGKPDHYIINDIVDKKKIGNKYQYKVNWKGYPHSEDSFIDESQLNRTEDLKQMKNEFNLNH